MSPAPHLPNLFCPDSSVLTFAVFDATNFKLLARVGGKLYVYSGVTQLVWEELVASDSKGHYFSTKIRERYRTDSLTSLV